jgi:hypothetical protein
MSWHPGVRGHDLRPVFDLPSGVAHVDITPDGRTMIIQRGDVVQALAMDDRSARERWRYAGVGEMYLGAISADSRQILAPLPDRTLVFLDMETGAEVRRIRVPEAATRYPRFARARLGAAVVPPGCAAATGPSDSPTPTRSASACTARARTTRRSRRSVAASVSPSPPAGSRTRSTDCTS